MLATIVTSLITALLVCSCKEFLVDRHRNTKQKQKREEEFKKAYSLTKNLVDDILDDLGTIPLRRRFLVSEYISPTAYRPKFQYYGQFYKNTDIDIIGCVDVLEDYGFIEWIKDNEAIARNGRPAGVYLKYYRMKEEFVDFLQKNK